MQHIHTASIPVQDHVSDLYNQVGFPPKTPVVGMNKQHRCDSHLLLLLLMVMMWMGMMMIMITPANDDAGCHYLDQDDDRDDDDQLCCVGVLVRYGRFS